VIDCWVRRFDTERAIPCSQYTRALEKLYRPHYSQCSVAPRQRTTCLMLKTAWYEPYSPRSGRGFTISVLPHVHTIRRCQLVLFPLLDAGLCRSGTSVMSEPPLEACVSPTTSRKLPLTAVGSRAQDVLRKTSLHQNYNMHLKQTHIHCTLHAANANPVDSRCRYKPSAMPGIANNREGGRVGQFR